jgi:dolichyl-phosphate-mannose--protein O-mannosyl transferase
MLDLFPGKGERLCRSVNRTLFLAGIVFGIGAACKWIALYAGCGVVLLVVLRTVADLRQRDYPAVYGMAGFLLRRIGVCLIAFGLLPALIYLLAYIPFLLLPGPGHGLADVFRLQAHILNYHRTLQATHPFSSPWWSWPLNLHPLWMYTGEGLPAGTASSIVSFGNPAVFWPGIPAVAATAVIAVRKRDTRSGAVLVALLCQYLPWVGIHRMAFIYHFFSTVPFLILCIVATLRSLELRCPRFRVVTWGYLGLAAGLFILFYPVLSGLQVSQGYVASLRWFPTWFF